MDPLHDPVPGAEHREVAGVSIDVVKVGGVRVKRVLYPPGFRWSTHMKPLVGTAHCQHAHVGFLVRGRVQGTYADGCPFDLRAPRTVALDPGHDAWVVGDEPAVLIEFDAEGDTVRRFGLPAAHVHARP